MRRSRFGAIDLQTALAYLLADDPETRAFFDHLIGPNGSAEYRGVVKSEWV